MTPQELAALPIGTKVGMQVGGWTPQTPELPDEVDCGVVTRSGMTCQIKWEDDGPENRIHTGDPWWHEFIEEIFVIEGGQ